MMLLKFYIKCLCCDSDKIIIYFDPNGEIFITCIDCWHTESAFEFSNTNTESDLVN